MAVRRRRHTSHASDAVRTPAMRRHQDCRRQDPEPPAKLRHGMPSGVSRAAGTLWLAGFGTTQRNGVMIGASERRCRILEPNKIPDQPIPARDLQTVNQTRPL